MQVRAVPASPLLLLVLLLTAMALGCGASSKASFPPPATPQTGASAGSTLPLSKSVFYVFAHQAFEGQAVSAFMAAEFDPKSGTFLSLDTPQQIPPCIRWFAHSSAYPSFLIGAGTNIDVYPIEASGGLGAPVFEVPNLGCSAAVALDSNGHFLYYNGYGSYGSAVGILKLDADGHLADTGQSFELPPPPAGSYQLAKIEQQTSNNSSGERLWVRIMNCRLGEKCEVALESLRIDPQTGALSQPVWNSLGTSLAPGLVFLGNTAVVGQDSAVASYTEKNGALTLVRSYSIGSHLNALVVDESTNVVYAADGRTLFAIAVDPTTSQLRTIDAINTETNILASPPAITFAGGVVYVQYGDAVGAFALDQQRGKLVLLAAFPTPAIPLAVGTP